MSLPGFANKTPQGGQQKTPLASAINKMQAQPANEMMHPGVQAATPAGGGQPPAGQQKSGSAPAPDMTMAAGQAQAQQQVAPQGQQTVAQAQQFLNSDTNYADYNGNGGVPGAPGTTYGPDAQVSQAQQTIQNADPNNAKTYNYNGQEVSKNYLQNLVNDYNPNIPNAMDPGVQQTAQAAEQALQTGSGSFDPSTAATHFSQGPSAQTLATQYNQAANSGQATDPNAWMAANNPSMVGGMEGQQGLNGATYNAQTKSWTNNGPSFNPGFGGNSPNGSGMATGIQQRATVPGTSGQGAGAQNAQGGGQSSPSSAAGNPQNFGAAGGGAGATPLGPPSNPPFGYQVGGSTTAYTALPSQYAGTAPVIPASSNLGLAPAALQSAITNSLTGNTALTPSESAGFNSNYNNAMGTYENSIAPFMNAIEGSTNAGLGVAGGGLSQQVIANNWLPSMMGMANNLAMGQQGAANSNQSNALAEVLAASLRPNPYASPLGVPNTGNQGTSVTINPYPGLNDFGNLSNNPPGNGTQNLPLQQQVNNQQGGLGGGTNSTGPNAAAGGGIPAGYGTSATGQGVGLGGTGPGGTLPGGIPAGYGTSATGQGVGFGGTGPGGSSPQGSYQVMNGDGTFNTYDANGNVVASNVEYDPALSSTAQSITSGSGVGIQPGWGYSGGGTQGTATYPTAVSTPDIYASYGSPGVDPTTTYGNY